MVTVSSVASSLTKMKSRVVKSSRASSSIVGQIINRIHVRVLERAARVDVFADNLARVGRVVYHDRVLCPVEHLSTSSVQQWQANPVVDLAPVDEMEETFLAAHGEAVRGTIAATEVIRVRAWRVPRLQPVGLQPAVIPAPRTSSVRTSASRRLRPDGSRPAAWRSMKDSACSPHRTRRRR